MAENTTVGHTPGPWDTRDDDKRITVGVGLVDGPNGYDVAEVYNDDCDRDEAWANAHLIAAAPELYEALIAVRRRGLPDRYTSDAELIAQVDAALLKASPRGGEGV